MLRGSTLFRKTMLSLRSGCTALPATAGQSRAKGPLNAANRRTVRAFATAEDMSYDFDLFTIGGGSGGVRGSRFAGGFGAKVACCELPFGYKSSQTVGGLGGTCVLRGCVPKKLVMYCSEYATYFKDSQGFGWEPATPKLDWPKFMDSKRKELQRLNSAYENTLGKADVKIIEGRGKIIDEHTVEVDGKKYTSKYIMVAVGGLPNMINVPGIEHCISSDGILELEAMPERLGIVGGGYIGVEFGGMFNNFGCKVDFFIRGDKLLRGFDEDIRDTLMTEYEKQGITLNTGQSPVKIEKNSDGSLTMTYKDGDGKESTKDFDQILFATGRKPNTENLGLENAGVKTNKGGYIEVDDYSKTSVDSIYAVGDITDRLALTPVALYEGGAVAKTLFNNQPSKAEHDFVATAVFAQPNIGTCGYSESQCIDKYGDVDVYTSSFKPMRNGFSGNDTKGFYKILVDANSDRVVGMHIMGPDSGEIMQGFGVAMKMGVTKAQVDNTIGIHPTAAEELVTMRTASRKYRGKKLVEE